MANLLLLTNSTGASADVLPALGLLQHNVKITPQEVSLLIDLPPVDCLLLDARRDLVASKSFTKLLIATGVDVPIIVITTEGGLSAINADWGITDVILDTAGPAELDARVRIVIGKDAIASLEKNPSLKEIRSGEVVIDEDSYTAKIKGRSLDLTFKEFELLKYLAQHPGRVFSRSQDYFGGTRTVDVHIRRLRSKLGPEFESIIDTVRNVGYRFAITNAGADTASDIKI